MLQNLHDGHFLNLRGNRPRLGAWVQLWENKCNIGNHWKIEPVIGTDNKFHICHRLDETMCLGVDAAHETRMVDVAAAFVPLVLVAKSDSSSKWLFRTDSNGHYVIGNSVQALLPPAFEMVIPILSRQLSRTLNASGEYDFLDRAKGARAVALSMTSTRKIAAFSEWQLFLAPEPEGSPVPRTVYSLPGPTGPVEAHSADWLREQAAQIPQMYVLQHAHSSLYLNVLGSEPWPGVTVHRWDDATNLGNHWKLVPTQLHEYEFFLVPILDFTLCLGLDHDWQVLNEGASTKLLSPLADSARWRFCADDLTGQTTLVNCMPLANTHGTSARAILQTPPGQFVGMWTQPIVLSMPAGNSSVWNVLLTPASAETAVGRMNDCPSRLAAALRPDASPPHQASSSSSSSQVPLPPCRDPENWRGYFDEATQTVWYVTHDNRWQSDGEKVGPYSEHY